MSFNLPHGREAAQNQTKPLEPDKQLDRDGHVVKQPISASKDHPVNQPDNTIYLSRTGNFNVGGRLLDEVERTKITEDVLRRAGPNGRLAIEADGSYGSYIAEVMPLLTGRSSPGALATIPPDQRPDISFLLSGGRPLLNTDFGQVVTSGEGREVGRTTDQNVTRVVPNWANASVATAYMSRVDDVIAQAKVGGLRPNITVDDHMGVPPAMMSTFKALNGLAPTERSDVAAQKIITGRIGEIADKAHANGGDFTLSLVGNPKDARKFGVDPFLIGNKIDVLEMQLYRESPENVKQNLEVAFNELKDRLSELPNMKEIRVALTTRANGHNLTESELIGQQKEVNAFETRLVALYRSQGLEPPKVTTSLWQYSSFYK
jgi:hypothetical protein